MQMIFFLLRQMLNFSVPLMLVALGGMFSNRSGIMNIGLEGIMVFGAFVSVLFLRLTRDTMSGQAQLLIAIILAVVAGMTISLFHALASINLKADQSISAQAINSFATAFSMFSARLIIGESRMEFKNTFILEKVPFLGDIPVIGDILFTKAYIITYLSVGIYLLSAFVLYHTRFGLRLRACGEFPQAADSVGINVARMRYAGVLISGALAGLGGLAFVIPNATNFNGSVSGYGFMALGIMILGHFTPSKILISSLVFSIAMTISSTYSAIPLLNNLGIAANYYKMAPYLLTLVVLLFSNHGGKGPKAAGQPYEKGMR